MVEVLRLQRCSFLLGILTDRSGIWGSHLGTTRTKNIEKETGSWAHHLSPGVSFALKSKFVFYGINTFSFSLNHFRLGFLLLIIKRILNDTCIISRLYCKGKKKCELYEQLTVNLPVKSWLRFTCQSIKDIKEKKS